MLREKEEQEDLQGSRELWVSRRSAAVLTTDAHQNAAHPGASWNDRIADTAPLQDVAIEEERAAARGQAYVAVAEPAATAV